MRETRHLTVTVDGDERDATWKQGVGIYVDGFGFGKGDVIEIEGEPHRAVEMRRMKMEGEALTLLGALLASPWPPNYLYIHLCSYT